MSQDTPLYEEWLRGYLTRGERLRSELVEALLTVRGTGVLALPELRIRRESFPHKFCLFQYASGYDEKLATELFDQLGMRFPEEGHSTLAETAAGTTGEALTTLMLLLDQIGTHLVLLERPNEMPPDGPLRLVSPDESWYPRFAQLAELAQAIILPAGIGPHVLQEIQYLQEAGLGRRIVLYCGKKLYLGGPDSPTVFDLADLEIATETPAAVKEAIEMAAAQPPTPESAAFIQDPQVPEWVMRGLEALPKRA